MKFIWSVVQDMNESHSNNQFSHVASSTLPCNSVRYVPILLWKNILKVAA